MALLSSLAATGLMGRAAHLGGQIRHDEIRPLAASVQSRSLEGMQTGE